MNEIDAAQARGIGKQGDPWKGIFNAALPDAGTRYIELQQQLTAVTQAQAHAVLLRHDHVAGLLTQRYNEILGTMGEIEANDKTVPTEEGGEKP